MSKKMPNDLEKMDLKPCPMSGKKAYVVKEGYNYQNRDLYHVVCHRSGIRTKNYLSAKEAVEAWNTRANDLDPSEATATPSDRIIEEQRACIRDLVEIAIGVRPAVVSYVCNCLGIEENDDRIKQTWVGTLDEALTTHAEIIERSN